MKNVLLVACLIAIPFAAARAAVRYFSGEQCHDCSGAFNESGSSGQPEMNCVTNNCRGGCSVYYEYWEAHDEEGYPVDFIESWLCLCAGVAGNHCTLAVSRITDIDPDDPIEVRWEYDCDGKCFQSGSCQGTTCKKNGTFWITCDCESH